VFLRLACSEITSWLASFFFANSDVAAPAVVKDVNRLEAGGEAGAALVPAAKDDEDGDKDDIDGCGVTRLLVLLLLRVSQLLPCGGAKVPKSGRGPGTSITCAHTQARRR
jgi:hypothetical protein